MNNNYAWEIRLNQDGIECHFLRYIYKNAAIWGNTDVHIMVMDNGASQFNDKYKYYICHRSSTIDYKRTLDDAQKAAIEHWEEWNSWRFSGKNDD